MIVYKYQIQEEFLNKINLVNASQAGAVKPSLQEDSNNTLSRKNAECETNACKHARYNNR
jgi:hypothetical protein